MNEKELLLTPRELYCLGGVLNAKYIDYAYIAALDDIGQDFELFQKETLASLSAKGIIMEDFGGNMEMNEEYIPLLEPIFFGAVETSLDVCHIGDNVTVDVYKFHFYQDRITMVAGEEDHLLVKQIYKDDIFDMTKSILDQDYFDVSGVHITEYDSEKVTRFLSAKSINIGVSSEVLTLIEFDGVFYIGSVENDLVSLSCDDFTSAVFDVIKGV